VLPLAGTLLSLGIRMPPIQREAQAATATSTRGEFARR